MTDLIDADWLRGADAGHFWLFTTAVWAVALAGFFAAWHFFRRLSLVEDTPQSLIRSAAQGYVELQGTGRLMPGPPIYAPLTRSACVWWSYRIEEYVHSGRSSHWSTIKDEASGELFLVEDDTGQCVVDPDGADVYPSAKDVWYGNTAMPEGGPGLGKLGMVSGFRYTEQRVQVGDPLYALGYFHTQGPITAADIDEDVRQQLVNWKQDQAWLLRNFDADRDGQIDQQEWDAARQEARRLVLEREREALQRPPVNVLGLPPDGRAFILSTLPQQGLETRLRLYVGACLLAFFCAGALGTYLVDVRLSTPPAGSHVSP